MANTVITIGRSYGSGGRTMAKMLAKKLGINCYDREILRMASDDSGINEALFGQADEKLNKSSLFGIVKKNPYKGGVIGPESADFVSDDYVLRDDPNVIRLFCYAPKDDCVKRVMEADGLDAKEAAKKIEKIDKFRADYYHYYTGGEWNDARNYNLCLDTTSMSYDQLIEIVETFIRVYHR